MAERVYGTSTGEATKPRGNEGPPSADEISQELSRILQSSSFRRSERLQRFLRFVCEHSVRGDGHLLHEYLIGVEVFGRGSQYSPHEDGIVRRQAHALRRKLQEYYEKDGIDDPVRIELPVGRYVPVFHYNAVQQENTTVEPAVPETDPGLEEARITSEPARRHGQLRWLVATVAGFALFVGGWFVGARTSPAAAPPASNVTPEEREIWGAWLDRSDGASICFSNPLTTVVKQYPELLDPHTQPPRQLLTPDQDRFFRSVVPLPPGGHLYFAPAISQTKMGEAFAAVYMTSLLARAGRTVRATQSRFVTWEDLTQQNIIFLGHNEANPWLDRILKNYPFKLVATTSDKQRAIINAKPDRGEPSEYHIRYGDEAVTATQEYALISMLPGADGRHLLLLINGLNTQATQSAAEFLTNSARLKELSRALRRLDPSHSGQWYFQAVVKTEVHDRVPTKAAMVDLKVIRQ